MKPGEVYKKYQEEFADKVENMSQEKVREIFEDAQAAEMPRIATVPYIGGEETIVHEFPELTALCPMTALPDSYTVRIKYVPAKKLPELKSLRYYLLAYRNLPIIHELMLDKIRVEFLEAVEPKELEVTLDVAVRGGIKTIVEGAWKK